jgi:hypothetical protein
MDYTQTTEIQLHPGVQQHDLLKAVAEGIIINTIDVFPQGICFLLGFLSNSGLRLQVFNQQDLLPTEVMHLGRQRSPGLNQRGLFLLRSI